MSQSEIATVNRQFEDAARKGDLERLASLYTRDAIALPPDSPMVKGRDNIKQMWGTIAQQIGLKDVRLNTIDLDMSGDTAYEVGEANLTIANGSAAVKFVVVWKKVDGQWRLHRGDLQSPRLRQAVVGLQLAAGRVDDGFERRQDRVDAELDARRIGSLQLVRGVDLGVDFDGLDRRPFQA